LRLEGHQRPGQALCVKRASPAGPEKRVPVMEAHPMTNQTPYRLHRRTLLTGGAVLSASAATACSSRPLQSGQQTPTAAVVEQNTTKRRGVGLRAFNPERASPGFTLFSPLIWGDGRVYLIDLHGTVVHTWNMPYPPGLSGYLTE